MGRVRRSQVGEVVKVAVVCPGKGQAMDTMHKKSDCGVREDVCGRI